jgi:Ran GTPase-activating protein (RanGAP) involved in mRNA processing and transport
MQRGLGANETLKELHFPNCRFRAEGLHLIVDALVGNTTMETFDMSDNAISSNGLDNITWLLGSTRIKKCRRSLVQ